MIAAQRRTPDGLQRRAQALAPVLFFGLGIGFHLALRHQFYANAGVAILALLWAATVWQRRWATPPAGPAAPRATPTLDEQAERLRLGMMLDQTPVPLVLSGQDGALRAVNRAARTLFGADDLIVPQPPALMKAMAAELPGRAVLRLPQPLDQFHADCPQSSGRETGLAVVLTSNFVTSTVPVCVTLL